MCFIRLLLLIFIFILPNGFDHAWKAVENEKLKPLTDMRCPKKSGRVDFDWIESSWCVFESIQMISNGIDRKSKQKKQHASMSGLFI